MRFVFEKKTHHTREFYRTTNLTDYTNTHHSVRVCLRDVLDRRTEVQVYFLSHADNAASIPCDAAIFREIREIRVKIIFRDVSQQGRSDLQNFVNFVIFV